MQQFLLRTPVMKQNTCLEISCEQRHRLRVYKKVAINIPMNLTASRFSNRGVNGNYPLLEFRRRVAVSLLNTNGTKPSGGGRPPLRDHGMQADPRFDISWDLLPTQSAVDAREAAAHLSFDQNLSNVTLVYAFRALKVIISFSCASYVLHFLVILHGIRMNTVFNFLMQIYTCMHIRFEIPSIFTCKSK